MATMAKKRQIIGDLMVLVYFTVTTLIISFPLVFHLHEYIFGLGDELLLTWIMNWDIYSFIHDPLQIYNATIFHPYSNTLTYSDAFFTSSLLALVPVLLTKSPLVAYNFTYLLAHISLGFFTYLLVKKVTGSRYGGVIAGTLASFTTYTVSRHFHLQLLSIQWIPLSLLFFFLYLKRGNFKYLFLCCLFFIIQTANSFLPGFFLLWCFIIWVLYLWFVDRKAVIKLLNKKVFMAAIVSLSVVFLIAFPYFQTSRQLNYVRDIRDTIRFANRPEYSLYPSDKTRVAGFLKDVFYTNDMQPIKHDGYIGLPLIVLSAIAFVYRFKGRNLSSYFDIFSLIAISSFILSLGPVVQWGGKVIKDPFMIPLPYAVFYYLVPGFKGFRSSERWEMLFVFSLAVAVSVFLVSYLRNASQRKKFAVSTLICLAVIAEVNFPYHYEKIPQQSEIPKVYSYLARLPNDTAIIELPMYTWNMTPHSQQENMRLYYNIFHHKRMMNGTSGFSPPAWERMVEYIYFHFPDRKTLDYLKDSNIQYIIVHTAEYDLLEKTNYTVMGKRTPTSKELEARMKDFGEIQFVRTIEKDHIYKIIYEEK